jgi:hypothetical protein
MKHVIQNGIPWHGVQNANSIVKHRVQNGSPKHVIQNGIPWHGVQNANQIVQ